MSSKTITIALFLFFALTPPAYAQLYACEKDGRRHYTSDPSDKECSLRQSYEKPAAGAAAPKKRQNANAPRVGTVPERAPQRLVPAEMQKQRDDKRSDVLRYELDSEMRLLNLLRRQINEAEDSTVAAYLREQAHVHALNINAIKRELQRLGVRVE